MAPRPTPHGGRSPLRAIAPTTLALLLAFGAGCGSGGGDVQPPRARTVLDDSVRNQVAVALASLQAEVTVRLYRGKPGEVGADEAEALLALMSSTSPRVRTAVHDLGELPKRAGFLSPAHGPVLTVEGPAPIAFRYLGYPSGMELDPFLEAVLCAGSGSPPMTARTEAFLASLKSPVSARVFVSPG